MKGAEYMSTSNKPEPKTPTPKPDLPVGSIEQANIDYALSGAVSKDAADKMIAVILANQDAKKTKKQGNLVNLEERVAKEIEDKWNTIMKIYELIGDDPITTADKKQIIDIATEGFIQASKAPNAWKNKPQSKFESSKAPNAWKNKPQSKFESRKQNFLDEINQLGGDFPKIELNKKKNQIK
jgi:hypothetical protein